MSDVTQILSQIEDDDPSAAERLLPLIYDELRKLAAARLAKENSGQTLQPTSLVHEAYIRLVDVEQAQHWRSRGHFFGAAAEAMRRILVENARGKATQKRGGDWERVNFEERHLVSRITPEQLLAIDEVLEGLEVEDALAGKLVRLRYFAGLSLKQAASTLDVSSATAYRHWAFARAWLRTTLLESDR